MFEKTKKYLKDNPKGYWFKNKLYGWGWTPVTWQGWLVIAVFVAYVLFSAFTLDKNANYQDMIFFLAKEVVAVVILLLICYKKGEKPRWRWGLTKEEEEKYNK
jgi:hypothetical protein